MEKYKYGEKYLQYEECEKLKSLANDERENCDTPLKKALVLLHYNIVAHYWRAREDIEDRKNCKSLLRKLRGKKYYNGYILDIDHYTENWIYSMRDHLWMRDGVYEELCKLYDPIKSKYLRDGHTIYNFDDEEN